MFYYFLCLHHSCSILFKMRREQDDTFVLAKDLFMMAQMRLHQPASPYSAIIWNFWLDASLMPHYPRVMFRAKLTPDVICRICRYAIYGYEANWSYTLAFCFMIIESGYATELDLGHIYGLHLHLRSANWVTTTMGGWNRGLVHLASNMQYKYDTLASAVDKLAELQLYLFPLFN
jgi:hypothetical protein